MPKIELNKSMTQMIFIMNEKQKNEKKEQFATGYGKIKKGNLVLDTFEEWPDELFDLRTETSITIKDGAWDWVITNMENKEADFIITLHTHPEWYGTNQPLDNDDYTTFKDWDEYFKNNYLRDNIININGIYSNNGGLKFYLYDEKSKDFMNVDFDVNENNYTSNNQVGRKKR